MSATKAQGELFPLLRNPEGTHLFNERCVLRVQDGYSVLSVCGVVLAHFPVGDALAQAHAMVELVAQGWADQNDVARVFGCSTRTVRRYQRRFEDGGWEALGRKRGYPKGRWRLPPARRGWVQRLKAQGHSNREIGRRLGVSEKAVRKLLRRLGWQDPLALQPSLPLPGLEAADPKRSAFSDPAPPAAAAESAPGADPKRSAGRKPDLEPWPWTLDTDPHHRHSDRLLARLGLLDDAAPLFGAATALPAAGVLLAVPALLATGVLDCARQIYGSLGPAFYGLRTTLVALLLLALLRLKRPEHLKEHCPAQLGQVLGLDRAPEVKTLRRQLGRLAALGRATELGRALAQRRVDQHGAALGFLYVDGHVRVYHGQRPVAKAHVARLRLAMPATTDYWVNDQQGDPLFVVTAEANATLRTMLPGILAEVRRLVGQRRLTFVFDRGGYSPPLFQQILEGGFDVLTYRKGRCRKVPQRCFCPHQLQVKGRSYHYRLADQQVRLGKARLRLRQVTRLGQDGHQTPILTSRTDLSAPAVAFHMFERWRQENFFKYLREEYALDALVDYQVLPEPPERLVRNPARKRLERKLRDAQAHLSRLQAEYGRQALANPEAQRPSMRGFKIAHGQLGQALRQARQRVGQLQARRANSPTHLPMSQTRLEPRVQLAPERKHLTNLLKMVAYQAENQLVRLIEPYYARTRDEGRTLIQSILTDAADLEVTDQELRIRLRPLSSAHRTRAAAALCNQLNLTRTAFPGSRLVLHYSIENGS